MDNMLEIVRDFKISANKHIPIPGMPGFLRPAKISLPDATVMAKWRNSNYQSFLTWVKPTADDFLNWLNQYQDMDDDIIFIIEMDTGQLAGQIALYNIDTSTNKAQFGRIIRDEEFGKKGLMTLASKVVLRWAFVQLRIKKAFLEVFADNVPAITLYERLGFRIADSNFVNKSVNHDGIIRWEKEGKAFPLKGSSLSNRRLLDTMTLDESRFYDNL